MFAYVKYIQDDVRAIVHTSQILNFAPKSRNDFLKSKIYLVFWSPSEEERIKERQDGDTEGDFYKSQILMLAETEEQLQKLISTSRIPVTKIRGMDEGSSDSDEGQMTKKRKVIHAEQVEKKLKCLQSKEVNCRAILAEKRKAMQRSPLVPSSSGGLRESGLDYSSDSSFDGGDVVPKKLLVEMEMRYTRLKKNIAVLKKREAETSQAMDELQLFKNKLQEVEEENKLLKKLNFELQEKIISRFTSDATLGAPEEAAGGQVTENRYAVKDGNVILGKTLSLPKEKWDIISKNVKDSIFIKDLAVAVWGSETLKGRSLDGIPCRRLMSKGALSKPPLTPAKVNDIRATFEDWLEKQGVEGAELKARSKKMKSYISDKIMYLNRKDRVINERGSNNVE